MNSLRAGRRDQEKLVVILLPLYSDTPISAFLQIAGLVLIRNLSLYQVGITGVNIVVMPEGKVVLGVGADDEYPIQVNSHKREYLDLGHEQVLQLRRALEDFKVEDDSRLVAVAYTETGRKFTSDTIGQKMRRVVGGLRRKLRLRR